MNAMPKQISARSEMKVERETDEAPKRLIYQTLRRDGYYADIVSGSGILYVGKFKRREDAEKACNERLKCRNVDAEDL